VLKADKKAAEEAAKKEKISLEEFLEVEVSLNYHCLMCPSAWLSNWPPGLRAKCVGET
jgi:hypothetical protein